MTKNIVLQIKGDTPEGTILADLINLDPRNKRDIAKLMGVSETRLNRERLLAMKEPFGWKMATAATLLYGLPPGTFKNARIPEGYTSAEEGAADIATGVKPVTLADIMREVLEVKVMVSALAESGRHAEPV